MEANQSSPTPTADEIADFLWKQRWDVRHKAWVMYRYQRRRQRFFDLVDKATKALTVMLGATLIGNELKNYQPTIASLISLVGLLSLVYGYGDRKQSHKELAEAAAALVAEIELVPAGQLDVALTAKWAADYAKLCAKAPPVLKTLTLMCEREQSAADGNPNNVPEQPRLRRFVADFMD